MLMWEWRVVDRVLAVKGAELYKDFRESPCGVPYIHQEQPAIVLFLQ